MKNSQSELPEPVTPSLSQNSIEIKSVSKKSLSIISDEFLSEG